MYFAESDFSLNETEVTSFSRLLILAVDSSVLPYTVEPGIQEPCLTEIVNTVTVVILSIPNHPYMSHHKAEKAVEVLVSLLKESGQLEGIKRYVSILMYHFNQISISIVKKLLILMKAIC